MSCLKETLSAFFFLFFFVSVKERQCKFPLAHILRQPWQDEVITEWLTHQHGKDLSPPGKEIAKSQFTHIQLPVRAWSRSCGPRSHTKTLWHQPMCAHTLMLQSEYSCQPRLRRAVFIFFSLSVYFISHASSAWAQCVPTCLDSALVSCQTHLLTPSKHWERQHYMQVCKGDQRRENPRNGWQTERESGV